MAYMPSINNLTGSKPQGYVVPGRGFGKPVQIEVAKTAALKKKTAPMPMNGTGGNYKFSKIPSNGIGVGP